MTTRKLTSEQVKQFKKDHAKLYKAGLVSKPARSQKVTQHALKQHEKFKAVLQGKAQVVTVPTKEAKNFKDKFASSKNKIVVPTTRKGERIRYNKKEKDIVSTRLEGGIKVKRSQKLRSIDELRALEGKNVTFSVIIPRATGNEIFRTKTIDEMSFIFARGSWRNFKEWATFVNVEKSERARAKIDAVGDEAE